MKKILSLAVALLLGTSALAQAPVKTFLLEPFDRAAEGATKSFPLDSVTASNEVVRKAYDTVANTGTGFIWGAHFNSTSAGQIVMSANGDATSVVQMGKDNWKPGNIVYTRFDTSALAFSAELKTNTNQYTVPAITLDASASGTKAILMYSYSDFVTNPPQVALLVRDDVGWWESNPVGLGEAWPLDKPYATIQFDLGSLTWKQIDTSKTGGQDMDQVDSNGETGGSPAAPLVLDYILPASGAPHLNLIQGIGWECMSSVAAGTGNAGLTNLIVGKLPPAPTGLVAEVPASNDKITLDWADLAEASKGYNVWRGTVAGGTKTKLTAAPIMVSNYADTTAQPNTDYFYVVTTVVDNAYVVESISSEATAKIKTVSAAREWTSFK